MKQVRIWLRKHKAIDLIGCPRKRVIRGILIYNLLKKVKLLMIKLKEFVLNQ